MSKSKESVSYLRNALKSSCLRCCRGHLLEQLIQREERIAGGSRHGLPESRLPGHWPGRPASSPWTNQALSWQLVNGGLIQCRPGLVRQDQTAWDGVLSAGLRPAPACRAARTINIFLKINKKNITYFETM